MRSTVIILNNICIMSNRFAYWYIYFDFVCEQTKGRQLHWVCHHWPITFPCVSFCSQPYFPLWTRMIESYLHSSWCHKLSLSMSHPGFTRDPILSPRLHTGSHTLPQASHGVLLLSDLVYLIFFSGKRLHSFLRSTHRAVQTNHCPCAYTSLCIGSGEHWIVYIETKTR